MIGSPPGTSPRRGQRMVIANRTLSRHNTGRGNQREASNSAAGPGLDRGDIVISCTASPMPHHESGGGRRRDGAARPFSWSTCVPRTSTGRCGSRDVYLFRLTPATVDRRESPATEVARARAAVDRRRSRAFSRRIAHQGSGAAIRALRQQRTGYAGKRWSRRPYALRRERRMTCWNISRIL